MARRTPGGRSSAEVLGRLEAVVTDLESITPSLAARTRKSLRDALASEITRLEQAAARLDPILRPHSVFDPSAPSTTGRVVALTMIGQPRRSLVSLRSFYGAGVYALYYNGPFDVYAPLSRTEQPIYIGKADPANTDAKDPVRQGTALVTRLNEHRLSIAKATSTLREEDFECRFLIVQTGYQTAAESYLINFFKPIWNNEMRICYGLGKHGDSAETRSNKRSPWDTLHPGRKWAAALAEDQKPESVIRSDIAAHLARVTPFHELETILEVFLRDLGQLAPMTFTTASSGGNSAAPEAADPRDDDAAV